MNAGAPDRRDTSAILDAVFENPHLVVALLDTSFRFLRVSRGYAFVDDRRPEELIGRNHFEVYPNPDNEAIFRRVVETGQPHVEFAKPFEYAENPERGTTWWDWSLIPLAGESGAVGSLLFILIDVSSRVRAEQALRARDRIAATSLEVMGDIFVVLDDHGRALSHNRAFLRATGLTGEDARERGIWPVLSAEARQMILDLRDGLYADGRPKTAEIRLKRPDGADLPIEFTAATVELDDARWAVVAVGRDLRPWRALQERLQEAERTEAVGRLAAGVAHDFNNILDVVVNNCDELLASPSLGEEARARLREIQDVGFRATALTRQLLAFARRQALTPERIDIGLVVRENERILRRLAGRQDALHLHIEPDLPTVLADRSQIEQVLFNLVSNAREAIGPQGMIVVSVRSALIAASEMVGGYLGQTQLPEGSYVRLTVRDDGRGMDAETRLHLFEPYFTTRREQGGTGLGLPTVYGVVAQSGGYIAVCSAPGEGTAFDILLPTLAAATRGTVAEIAPDDRACASLRLLVVEDNPIVRDGLVRRLGREGHAVQAAENGQRALALADRADLRFDVLITDIRLPDVNGRELAARIRASRPEIGIVFVSGYLAEAQTAAGETGDRVRFLEKPVNSARLLQTLCELADCPHGSGRP